MGLRYEVYTLPWDTGGFKKKFFWLPTIEGSGRGTVEFLTTSGDGSVDVPVDKLAEAGRDLTEIVSDTTSSLIRVIDCLPDGTNTIIDEWVCERPAREHADSKVVTISGPKLKAKTFDGQTFPAQDGLNPTKNPDHIFGGDNILQNPGFEDLDTQSSIFRLLIDATAGTFTLSIGSGSTDPIPYNVNDGALEGAIEDAVTGIADDVSVTPLDGLVDVYKLEITAESGTFLLSDGVDDTAAIAFNASAATIETRIVADIASINDVDVVLVNDPDGDYFTIEFIDPVAGTLQIDTTNLDDGSATLSPSRTASGGFEIEFITPAIANLTVNPAGLTGSASVVRTQEGEETASGWTVSQQISAGTPRPYGTYDAFQVSTAQAHSGTSSLFIDPAPINSYLDMWAGAQQVIGVEPGQLYQASIWVYPTAPGQTYRLVIRGIDEDLISKPLFAGNISPPANTWTQVVLKDIQVEEDSAVIFRFANINLSGNPAGFYIDDAYLAPGFAANTWGHIVNYFMDLKTTEFDWVDYSSVTTPLDSGGVAWPQVESVTGYFGESFGQFWDKGVDLEYEWDLRPKAVPVGSLTHDLIWFRSGGMDDAPSIGLYPNASITGGDSLTRTPAYTKVRVEGSDGLFVEVEDAAAVASFGPLEKHIRDTSLHSTESLTARANAQLAYESANRNAVHFQMVEHAILPRPGTHFRVGDTVPMQLPPGLEKTSKRVQLFSYTNTFPTQYLVTGSRVYEGEAAAYSLLWRLWRRFLIPERPKKAGALDLGGGGGTPTIVVRAVGAADVTDGKQDLQCLGVDDQLVIQQANDLIADVGGEIVLTEGDYFCSDSFTLSPNVRLRGMGNSTNLIFSNASTGVILGGNWSGISKLKIDSRGFGVQVQGSVCSIEHIFFAGALTSEPCILIPNTISFFHVSSCYSEASGSFIAATGASTHLQEAVITNNIVEYSGVSGPGGNPIIGLDNSYHIKLIITDNSFDNGNGIRIGSNTTISPVAGHIIAGNTFSSGDTGIYLARANRSIVAKNRIAPDGHGIVLDDVSEATVRDNTVEGFGSFANNTYDGIHLENDSDLNVIQANKLIPRGSGNVSRFGINIADATCDGNAVIHNDLRPTASYGSGDLNDAGTGTIEHGNLSDSGIGSGGDVSQSNTSTFSQAGTLSTGVGPFKLPFTLAAEIISVLLSVGTSPTGADLIVDINKNGTTIFTTQANRPTVPDGDANGVGAEAVPDVVSIAEGDYLTVDIDQVGSTVAGVDLTVVVEWRPT